MPAKKTQTIEKKAKPATIVKKFSGVVVGDQNDKTVIEKMETVKVHPKYKKRYVVSRRYKVHDEKNEHKIGDKVSFVECRPLSRDKRWRLIK